VNPYGVDWLPFLRFVASRINTETGTQYADDPTIALLSFAGEVDGINGGDNIYGLTTAQLTGFYRTVENFWHEAALGQLLTAGGLSQLYWNSGIDWRAIFSLPHNDINSLHAYTSDDVAISVPAVAEFSRSEGKPWIIEEFGFPASAACCTDESIQPGASTADEKNCSVTHLYFSSRLVLSQVADW